MKNDTYLIPDNTDRMRQVHKHSPATMRWAEEYVQIIVQLNGFSSQLQMNWNLLLSKFI